MRYAPAAGLLLFAALLPAQTPRVRYVDISFMETDLPDLKYGGNTNPWTNRWEDLYLDMYIPVGDTAPKRPVYIHVHGGQFYYGSKRNGEALMFCKDLTYRGWVTVSIDYRLATGPDHRGWGPDICAEDAKAAVRWVRKNAAQYRLDPDRIVLGGDSAAAGSIMIAAYTPWAGTSGNPGYSHVPNALFNMWGWHSTSINDPRCSIVTVHGMKDHATSYLNAEAIHRDAQSHGVFSQLQLMPELGHSPFPEWPQYRPGVLSFFYEALYLHELSGLGAVSGWSAGQPITMHASGWQDDVAVMFAGTALPAPIPVPGFGELWLDPFRAIGFAPIRFTTQSTETKTRTLNVPAELRGLRVDWQALYLPKAGRVGLFSNLLRTQF
jgi:acetyl esterase/lipase